jgi:hypothetical protein
MSLLLLLGPICMRDAPLQALLPSLCQMAAVLLHEALPVASLDRREGLQRVLK